MKTLQAYLLLILLSSFSSHAGTLLGDDTFYTHNPYEIYLYDDKILNEIKSTLGPFYGIVDMCYTFTPPTINNYISDINLCDSLPVINIDPCKSLPNLSVFGFTKRTMFGRKHFNTKDYCNKFINSKKVKLKMTDAMKNVNLSLNLFDKDDTNLIKSSDIPSASIKEHKALAKIVKNNDYMSNFIVTAIFNNSKKIDLDEFDLNNINTEYETQKDFEKSVKSLKENFLMIKDELDVGALREKAKAAFFEVNKDFPLDSKVDNNGKVISEYKRNKQKESVKGELLKNYQKLLDRYYRVLTKKELFLKYRPSVAMPTKEYLKNYDSEARLRKIYEIELQKFQKATILEEVTEKVTAMKNKAIRAINIELSLSREFNLKKSLADIKELTKDHN